MQVNSYAYFIKLWIEHITRTENAKGFWFRWEQMWYNKIKIIGNGRKM